MMLRRLMWAGLAVAGVAGICVLAFASFNLLNGKTGGPVQVVNASADVVARGKYLAEAADCAACHTAPGGAPFGGGLAMQSGFGVIYTTNITPDPEHGIGRWTADDFWRSMHDGVRRDGSQLYPAMPYTSYRGMTRNDADAVYAYLMHLRPMNVANRNSELAFPFDIRLGMRFWNVVFLTDSIPAASIGNSADWQRGRYVVNVLGHCGECHTPRGVVGEMQLSRPLSGFALGRVAAPDITPAGLASRGWTAEALSGFLDQGLSPQGSAFSDMHPVVMLSTRHLTPTDLHAAVTFLLGDTPAAVMGLAGRVAPDAERTGYLALCAGCHGPDGHGIPNTVVGLRENTTVRLRDPRNLIVSILDGIPAQNFPNLQSMQAMPGFADMLDDEQAARLVNYLRVTWGGQENGVTAATVHSFRLGMARP
jgi:mono/diheme cytochrome c family protein